MKKFKQKDIVKMLDPPASACWINQVIQKKTRPGWLKAKQLGAITGTPPCFWYDATEEQMRALMRYGCLENIKFCPACKVPNQTEGER